MSEVMAETGLNEDQVFDLGISGSLTFLVVVPMLGACRVPEEALSHFMAGADDFPADGLQTFYGGASSGAWTIRRAMLRVLPDGVLELAIEAEAFSGLLMCVPAIQNVTTAAPADVASVGTVTVWTPERKNAARAMLNKLNGDGYKAYAAATAAHFNVTSTRLRQVLNDKPKKTSPKKKGVWDL